MFKIFCIAIFTILLAGTQPVKEAPDIAVHLKKLVAVEVAKECPSCKVELDIHNQKILDDIAVPDRVISDRWKGQTNLILKIGEKNRVVTTTIRWKDQVVIAKRNLRQGKVIAAEDLRTIEKDVTFLQTAYLAKREEAIGFSVRKLFKRGQVLDENYLKKPLVVKFGQPIKVILKEGSLYLAMNGKARGAGAIGDRIPIFVTNTRKKLFAVIVDKSTVRIE